MEFWLSVNCSFEQADLWLVPTFAHAQKLLVPPADVFGVEREQVIEVDELAGHVVFRRVPQEALRCNRHSL